MMEIRQATEILIRAGLILRRVALATRDNIPPVDVISQMNAANISANQIKMAEKVLLKAIITQ